MRRLLIAVALSVGVSSVASAQVPVARALGDLSGTICVPGATSTATSCVVFAVAGYGTATVTVSGTFVATITFTGSASQTVAPTDNVGCTSSAAGSSASNTQSAAGTYICPVAGLAVLKMNLTAYTSGTAHVDVQAVVAGGSGTSSSSMPTGGAGTPNASVISVQGITGMTPLLVTATISGTVPVSMTSTSVAGLLSNNTAAPAATTNLAAMPCVVGASAPSYTDGRLVFLRCDTGGAPYFNVNNPSPVDANSYPITAQAATATSTGAYLSCPLTSAASTNATNCKASAGNFYGFWMVNTTATLYYLRPYNLATAPTCSSATGVVGPSIPIPASATGAGIVVILPAGINYSTGIGFCFTGGAGTTDNTNAATGVFGAVLYK